MTNRVIVPTQFLDHTLLQYDVDERKRCGRCGWCAGSCKWLLYGCAWGWEAIGARRRRVGLGLSWGSYNQLFDSVLYQAYHFDAFSYKSCRTSWTSFTSCNAVSHFYLLLGSGSLRIYRHQLRPSPRKQLIGDCTDLSTHCRTVWNIIWSSLITIFSCTWIAVHPNIPCPKKQNPLISFAEHRLPLFVCALLVAEYVLAWAIRQFWRAREMAKKNKR